MALIPYDDRPLHRQLASLLRDRILRGDLEPGDMLPTQAELVTEYAVSTNTVRDAIDMLRGEGLVETRRGRGIYVRQPPHVRRVSSERYRDQLDALAEGRRNESSAFTRDLGIDWDEYTIDCDFREAPAPTGIAELLGVEPGMIVFSRHMVMRARGQAEQLRAAYYPLDLVAGTPFTDPARQPFPGGVIVELAELGITISPGGAIDEDVQARMPTPDEAALLNIPSGVPVLVRTRVGRTAKRPVEAAELIEPGDRIILHYRLDL